MHSSIAETDREIVQPYFKEKTDEYLTVLGFNGTPGRFRLHVPALIGGEFYAAWQKLFVAFWLILVLNITGATLVAQGLFQDLGSQQAARSAQFRGLIAERSQRIAALEAEGQDASSLKNTTAALQRAVADADTQATEAKKGAIARVAVGILTLIVVRFSWAAIAPGVIRRRFERWRSMPAIGTPGGAASLYFAVIMPLFLYVAIIARFALNQTPAWLSAPPEFKSLRFSAADSIDRVFAWLTINFQAGFDFITISITRTLGAIETLLIGIPWFVIGLVVVSVAYKVANPRTAIFCAISITYLVVFDFWTSSMYTLSLLGVAAGLSIIIGIPLGIVCAKSERSYAIVRPMLDLMQTMPSFVYLIPVIAFFGTGKPPGVIATIVFGMPPVVRLTVLGIRNVPEAVVEAAEAFGASKWFVLTRVQLPLAKSSIMTGVNQTILMSLSMVVIASLIGAKGLGENVLEALQYSAKGQGLLAGVAILLCAMMLDRIVQGKQQKPSD
jgi:glycine betaine/proline transport system permease protein